MDKNVEVIDLKGEFTASFELWRTSLTSLSMIYFASFEFFFKTVSFALTTCNYFREIPHSFFA